MENIRKYFGEVLREIRRKRGLTAEEIAEKYGLSVQSIYGYERGLYMPKSRNGQKLYDALRIDPAILEQEIRDSVLVVGSSESTGQGEEHPGRYQAREDVQDKAEEIIQLSARKSEPVAAPQGSAISDPLLTVIINAWADLTIDDHAEVVKAVLKMQKVNRGNK